MDPTSDFDAGLNTSAAWIDAASASDDDEEGDDNDEHRPARALYAFEGKPEFRELSVEAGDALEVLRECLPDGWSLVRTTTTRDRQIGLLPRSYYTFTSEFVSTPRNSTIVITPRAASPDTDQHTPLPILPQTTGEWRGPFPKNLLGGRSLNRFSSFVTSGAEAWVLNGATPTATNEPQDPDNHFIDIGPSWKAKIPPFRILVHSPSKRTSVLSGAYTIYNITSLFSEPYQQQHSRIHSFFNTPSSSSSDEDTPQPSSLLPRLTVHRRFSHFVLLHTALTRRLPGIALPPLPEKQYSGRFNSDFIEARRGDLERYINKVIRHPVARYAEILTLFLSCENDTAWSKLLPQHLNLPPAGPSFYAKVYHPAFNIDAEDAQDAGHAFSAHTKAVAKAVQGLRSVFTKVREARLEMAKAERGLGYAILGMITVPPSIPETLEEEEVEEAEADTRGRRKEGGVVNKDGAWCWRESCQECLKLTKGLQKLSETLQSVADLYDDHARRTQLATHESLKSMAHPDAIYEPTITNHKATLSRYNEASANHNDTANKNSELAARCETVLNTTMAEMDTYHFQKVEDFELLARDHLDGEIRVYEQIIARLRTARQTFTPPAYDDLANSPRSTSLYERELFPPPPPPLLSPSPSTSRFFGTHLSSNSTTHKFIPTMHTHTGSTSSSGTTNINTNANTTTTTTTNPQINIKSNANATSGIGEILIPPLPQPHPHVFDSTPMRPVSVAVQEVVGVTTSGLRLLRGGSGGGGGESGSNDSMSVFGRFWASSSS